MTVWCIHIACWISKVTNTHLEYVLLYALPLQQWTCFIVILYVHCQSCFI